MIKIYKDTTANAIFIQDTNGAQFINTLQATVDSSDLVSITDVAKGFEIVSGESHTDFVDENDVAYQGTALEVCNALNALFSASGTPSGSAPTITSSLAVSLTEGDTLNYELTADFGVGYEWDLSNVSGITTVEGNPRKLIGGSSLTDGTYSIPVKAINYNGEDSQTITLTVSSPPFSNTKSLNFSNQDYLGANAALVAGILGRTGNGSGASDAWTIAFWFKASTNTQGQTIFYFGDNDANNGGYIQLMQLNNGGNKALRLRYGSNNNRLNIQTLFGSLVPNTWQHVMVTYDGGTTGSSSSLADLTNYYSRFKIYIDGSLQTTNNTNSNYGWSSGIDADNFRIGRFTSGNYMRDCRVDEIALWGSDQSSNVSDIYNSGAPFDLLTLTDQPPHWWPIDGSTYSYIQDEGATGGCTFVMYNMTAADIVSDAP